MARSLFARPLDLLFFVYFLTHIPISLLMGPQYFLPANMFPQPVIAVVDDYIRDSGDWLVGTKPGWFKSIVVAEVLYQLPFFFYGAFATYGDWASWRIPGIIYASHVTTTLVPIIGAFYLEITKLSESQATLLFSVYSVWVVIPLVMLYRLTLGWDHPSGIAVATGKKKKTA